MPQCVDEIRKELTRLEQVVSQVRESWGYGGDEGENGFSADLGNEVQSAGERLVSLLEQVQRQVPVPDKLHRDMDWLLADLKPAIEYYRDLEEPDGGAASDI
ncbi:hypothetical protein ABZ023_35135, partial [Streptomyces sp. NPDC006367]